MISMNQVWDDSVAFIRRESALLVPLALATIYIGGVIASLAQGFSTPGKPNALAGFLVLAALIWSTVGQLAVMSLVLRPGQSVGEAIQHGLSRLGKVVLVGLLIILAAFVALLPIGAALMASGVDPKNPASLQSVPGWISLLLLAMLAAFLWLTVRLSLMSSLIVDRNPGVIESIKSGFALTRGVTARLVLVVMLYLAMVLILGSAVQFVAGSIFELLGRAIGSPFAGTVMTALVLGLVSTAMSLIATVFLATLYRRVNRTA
jgi:hypothetical protein